MADGEDHALPGGGAVRPLPPCAAEVAGVDLARPVDAATRAALQALMARHRILVFRDQRLAPEDQVRALALFGDNVLDESRNGSRYIYVSGDDTGVNPGRLLFHSDNHFTALPLERLSLYAEDVDERAASTLFVDNVRAFERLPPALRDRLVGAWTVNVSYYYWGQGSDRPSRSVVPDHPEAPRAVHPAVWRHPVSGEPFVYITELHTHHLLDMPLGESDALLEKVRAEMYASANIFEHRWRTGDLVVWDNRAAQHARGYVPDSRAEPAAPRRALRRCVAGPKAFHEQVTLPASVRPAM
jgi:taurine dioxygenase